MGRDRTITVLKIEGHFILSHRHGVVS
jgi:hypothetical protein